jgi:RHH-type proline utilization regulon transcriptional repressor/proline dehydrogenase/delta 1-pyrroline-5-carboxylate dehydrogenase
MPRERVLCVADNEQDALVQLAAAVATGCEVLWPEEGLHRDLAKQLPKAGRVAFTLPKPMSCSPNRLMR